MGPGRQADEAAAAPTLEAGAVRAGRAGPVAQRGREGPEGREALRPQQAVRPDGTAWVGVHPRDRPLLKRAEAEAEALEPRRSRR